MVDALKVQTGMSLAVFIEAYDQQSFELINGAVGGVESACSRAPVPANCMI